MKNKILVALMVIVMISITLVNVQALGISYTTSSIIVNQSDKFCLNYTIFNTETNEMSGHLELSDSLLIMNKNKTYQSNIISVSGLSDEIKKQYKGQALRNYLANHSLLKNVEVCLQAPNKCNTTYRGEVILVPKTAQTNVSGSSLAMRTSVPLSVVVKCNPKKNNIIIWLYILIYLIILMIKWIKRKNKYGHNEIREEEGAKRNL